jgi:hypothetical protein
MFAVADSSKYATAEGFTIEILFLNILTTLYISMLLFIQ